MTNNLYVARTALIVALGGFLMGFDASVISGVVKFIEIEFSLSSMELGFAVSSLTLTATLAMMVSGPLSDAIGRRTVLYGAAVLYAISAIGSALAPTYAFLVVARMVGGLGVGALPHHCPDVYRRDRAPASPGTDGVLQPAEHRHRDFCRLLYQLSHSATGAVECRMGAVTHVRPPQLALDARLGDASRHTVFRLSLYRPREPAMARDEGQERRRAGHHDQGERCGGCQARPGKSTEQPAG